MLRVFIAWICPFLVVAQTRTMTPEILWSLGRVVPYAQNPKTKEIVFGVTHHVKESNKSVTQLYSINPQTKETFKMSQAQGYAGDYSTSGDGRFIFRQDNEWINFMMDRVIKKTDLEYNNPLISPMGNKIAFSRRVKAMITKEELYPQLTKSEARIYDDLMFRHWNQWEDGFVNHVFVADFDRDVVFNERDIMAGEPYDCPTMPSGTAADMSWSRDERWLAYVCVKKSGKEYAVSTNSDIYLYDIENSNTINISADNPGYDTHPAFSPDGKYIAWTSMRRDGYESDKNDIVIMELATQRKINLTADWDGTVQSFIFSSSSELIYFNAPHQGVVQIFEVNISDCFSANFKPILRQITNSDVDYPTIISQDEGVLYCTRTDMNHPAEIFSVSISDGSAEQLTHVNDSIMGDIKMCKVEKRWTNTVDGKTMLTWVIYPPDFDGAKKYPTLLYCQGGPQTALSQFYSYRWNFQLMASQGYIVVAPNRRGMPGWGLEWNEQISGDWGGLCMQDYLAAIDDIATEPYVDRQRLACVGASFGGYSVFMLAGMHENRFKSFISHCGTFNLESWYGSTEEIWFSDFDLKGPYWSDPKPISYEKYSPHKFVQKWNAPILIIQGGRDYRIPDTQAFEAFTAARLRNIKARLLYLPDEGHHVLKIQNGLLWQAEFFRWLRETL